MVELVFVGRERRIVSVEDAWAICSDQMTAGKVIDALTPDKQLQDALRKRMDELFG